MTLRRTIAILALPTVLSACGTPTYVDKGQGESGWLGVNEVVFQVHPSYKSAPPDCVAILPFTTKTDMNPAPKAEDSARVRMSFYAHLSTQSKRIVRLERVDHVLQDAKDDRKTLGEQLKCAAFIEGNVTEYGSAFFGLYSRVAVGLDVKMSRADDGAVLWEGHHTAAYHGGGLPLDPIGAGLGLADAVGNFVGDEQINRVTDDLTRRLVSTIPDNQVAAMEDPVEETSYPTVLKPAAVDDLSLAETLLSQGDYAGALAAAERAIVTSSDPAKAWFVKGRVLLLVRDYAAAEPAIIKAVALDRGNVTYLNALGAVNAETGRLDRALAAYRMALTYDPTDGFAWYNSAIINFNTGHSAEAADGFYQAALAYVKTGNAVKAERALSDLKDLGPSEPSVPAKAHAVEDALASLARRKS